MMQGVRILRFRSATSLLSLLVVLLTGTLGIARVVAAHPSGVSGCAAVGTYVVGSNDVVPYATPLPQSGAPGRAQAIYPIPYDLGALRGTITLRAYTGCGTATNGSFFVHGSASPAPLPRAARGAPSSKASIAYPFFGTGVLTATGTLVQDALHPADAGYVLVRASVIFGTQTIVCGEVCAPSSATAPFPCPQAGCRGGIVVSRVATFHDVTGYLRLQPGSPPSLGLTFLPPPDPRVVGAGAALSLQPISFTGLRNGS